MGAVYRKELKSYFHSATGYTFIAVVLFLSGVFFFMTNITAYSAEMSSFFSMFQQIVVFIIPLLTMKIWADEKRNKTDQALLTAPVGLLSITLGKFFAAMTVYLVAISITVVYALTLASFASVDTLVIIGNVFGMILVGAAMIAIGMFISNLTESQIIAAVVTFGVALMLLLLQSFSTLSGLPEIVSQIILAASLFSRYQDFSVGIFSYADVIYYLSVATVFIFLTVRALEKRRWA